MYRISLTALIAVNTGLLLFARAPAHKVAANSSDGSLALAALPPDQPASAKAAGEPTTPCPTTQGLAKQDVAVPGDPPETGPEDTAAPVVETPAIKADDSESDVEATRPEPATDAKPAPLVLMNSRSSGAAIGYLLDGEEFWLAPGERHELERGEFRELVFHRGGEFGVACHELKSGFHRFVATPEGWELTPVAGDEPTPRR